MEHSGEVEVSQTIESFTEKEWLARAETTWTSLQTLINPSGLCGDRVQYSAEGKKIGWQTKPTNIGLGLLAVLSAEQLDFISPSQSEKRLRMMLTAISGLEREKGFFYDWYDSQTGKSLDTWPENGSPIRRFLSSVDNAWMAVSLMLVAQAKPEFADQINPILEGMDFSTFFDDKTQELWGGYELDKNVPTGWHYGRQFMSESRITHYVAAALAPEAQKAKILERLLDKNGKVPDSTYGGSLFEELMPTLFVNEMVFASRHQAEIAKQIHEAHPDGWWGLSACDNPNNGKYMEVGIGGAYKNLPIISPYSLFLALKYEPGKVEEMVARLEETYPVYTKEGYRDSVDVDTGKVAGSQLFLDQALILFSLTNRLKSDYFPKLMQQRLRPKSKAPKLFIRAGREVQSS